MTIIGEYRTNIFFVLKGAFAVIFSDSKVKGIEKSWENLEQVMHSVGFVTHNWDYEKATYDLMMKENGQTYYLRILADLVKGKIQHPDSVLKLNVPVIGRHLFPHGIDYQSEVPAKIAEQAKEVIAALETKLGA